jgi:hypothetical protein
MPRFSIKALLLATTLVAVIAAVLNAPDTAVARLVVAIELAMVFAIVGVLLLFDWFWTPNHITRVPIHWTFPVICFALCAWSILQVVLAARQM